MNNYQFLPRLSLEEYEALWESIRVRGVIDPIILDEEGNIIDGHHRWQICVDMGVECPSKTVEGLTEEQKQDLALELNLHRRHLTKEQKKELAISLREQGWTQERIGKVTGTPQQTVSRWLKEINTHLSKTTIPDSLPTTEQPSAKDLTRTMKEMEKDHEAEVRRIRAEYECKLASVPKPEKEVVEVEVVPEAVKEEMSIMKGKIEALSRDLSSRTQHIQEMREAGRDVKALEEEKIQIKEAIRDLKQQHAVIDNRRRYAIELAQAARGVNGAINKYWGIAEEASVKGIPTICDAHSVQGGN